MMRVGRLDVVVDDVFFSCLEKLGLDVPFVRGAHDHDDGSSNERGG